MKVYEALSATKQFTKQWRLYNLHGNPIKGLKAGNLIKSKNLYSNFFQDSWILLLKYNADEGAQGLVLNKTIE